MSIQEISSNFKHFLKRSDVSLTFLIIVVALGSFFLGRGTEGTQTVPRQVIITETRNEASIIQTRESEELGEERLVSTTIPTTSFDAKVPTDGGYVASKNGTKYHLPWCGSAKQIKEENKIWFATKAEAEAAGYTPASNCKGI
jgi:hypothetical protein